MNGAFALWEDLLFFLARRPPFPLGALVDQLVAKVTTAFLDPASDPQQEAAYLWLLRLLVTNEQWAALRPDLDELMTRLLRQPGVWSLRLATDLVEAPNSGVSAAEWTDIIALAKLQAES